MYDQCKHHCRNFCHTINHQHRLDGKMPRTCTVGSGHQNGKRADTEDEQYGEGREMGGEVEAKEGYIKMQKVTCPYRHGIKKIQREASYVAQGQHTRFYVHKDVFAFLESRIAPNQHQKRGDNGYDAQERDDISRLRKPSQDVMDTGAGSMQEFQERRQLHRQGKSRYHDNQQAIYDTFGDYRAQRF